MGPPLHNNLTSPVLVGVISDTHGLLRPEALEALRGAQHIIHAGDIGKPELLDQLRALAPLTAVRGNVDRGVWARKLPETEVVELGPSRSTSCTTWASSVSSQRRQVSTS